MAPRKRLRTPRRRKGSAGRRRRKRPGSLFEVLVKVQQRLRAPDGCPWDRVQTHDSLRPYLVEEAYEVLDALDTGDPAKIAEELGDLLLQVVFHAQIGAEAGRFDIGDVIESIRAKLVRRHPHVFGGVKAETPEQVKKNWERLKAEERRAQGQRGARAGQAEPPSVLDGVPASLPALLEAHQLSRRAANVGFDWHDAEGLFTKLAEEAGELRRAVASGDRGRIEEEAGDLLFVAANLARFLGLDAEIALKRANRKFARRFRAMERIAAARGRTLAALSSDELEALWEETKGRATG